MYFLKPQSAKQWDQQKHKNNYIYIYIYICFLIPRIYNIK